MFVPTCGLCSQSRGTRAILVCVLFLRALVLRYRWQISNVLLLRESLRVLPSFLETPFRSLWPQPIWIYLKVSIKLYRMDPTLTRRHYAIPLREETAGSIDTELQQNNNVIALMTHRSISQTIQYITILGGCQSTQAKIMRKHCISCRHAAPSPH